MAAQLFLGVRVISILVAGQPNCFVRGYNTTAINKSEQGAVISSATAGCPLETTACGSRFPAFDDLVWSSAFEVDGSPNCAVVVGVRSRHHLVIGFFGLYDR